MSLAAIALSLMVYAALSLAVSRIFQRAGYGRFWQWLAFLPFVIVAAGNAGLLVDPTFTPARWMLLLVVFGYMGLLFVLAFGRWPSGR